MQHMNNLIRQKKAHKQMLTAEIKWLHFLLSTAIFYTFWMYFRYGQLLPAKEVGFRYNYYILAAYGAILFFFNETYNSYLLGFNRIRDLVFSQFISQLFSAIIIYMLVSISWNHWKACWIFLPMLAIQLFFDALWSYKANSFYLKLYPPKKTILIYRNSVDKKRAIHVKGKPSERLYRIAGELKFDGRFSEIRKVLDDYEAVIVAGVNSRCRNGILKYCKETGMPGFFFPHVGDVIMQEAQHIQSFDSPILFVSRTEIKPEYRFVKRLLDLVLSGAGIIILSPIMAVISLAIWMHDHGPAIYRQVRLTEDGKVFEVLKFRSMIIDAEKNGVARLSSGDSDDRVTPVGRVIRRYRLDELPQLFNVLKGDMSIVGPRPERPEIAEQYYQTIPEFKLRLQVKAGLTGYAQIYGRYNTDPYEKLEFDLLYINNMSALTDLKLIFATLFVLFHKDSVEGIETGQITALNYEKGAEPEASCEDKTTVSS